MSKIKVLSAVLVMAFAQGAAAQTLTGGEWTVVALDGATLPAENGPTIEFLAEGRVAGHSGCNRFMGSWLQDGNTLSFGPLAGTMMACEESRMALEGQIHAALGAVTTVALTPGGALELLGPEGLLIRATR